MTDTIKPKLENADKGFNYTVSKKQIEAYQKWSIKERLQWIWDTNMLLNKIQTTEERERARLIKYKLNR